MRPAAFAKPPARDAATPRARPAKAAAPKPAPRAHDAEELAALIAHLAGQLGIDASRITVRQDPVARAAARARSVSAFAEHGVIHLREPLHDPVSSASRQLIAHEAAHVAQSLKAGAPFAPLADVRGPAEIEAEVFARRYAATRTGKPVVVPLPPVAAAKEDFKAETDTVAQARAEEIAHIVDRLSYGLLDWAVTDGDIFDVLRVLDMFPMVTARAIGSAIGGKMRGRFFGNLNDPHYASYRKQILAIGWAAESPKEFAEGDNELLAKIALEDLEPIEAIAVDAIATLAPAVKTAAEADPKRKTRLAEIQSFAGSDKAQAELVKAKDEAAKEERAAQDEKEKLLAKAKELNLGGELDTLALRIMRKLDELHVSDVEAIALLDEIVKACIATRDPGEKVQALALFLGEKWLDELIDQIPAKGLYENEHRRRIYVHLLSARPPFKNLRAADDLLDSPWFAFWDTVTSEEAYLAFLLVKSMPDRARAAMIKAFGGETWQQIIDELPQNIRESADFSFYLGGEKQDDREALLLSLTDKALWDGSQPERLDAMLRIAEAAGEAPFAFEQSKRQRADLVPALDALVDKYALYREGKRDAYAEKALEGHAWYEEGLLGKFAGVFRFFKLLFGVRNLHLLGGKLGADIDLVDLHDYGGIPTRGNADASLIRGARFRRTPRDERKKAREAGQIPENVLRASKDDSGEIVIDAPRLVLDKLVLAGETRISAAPVTCTGLHASVRYTPDTKKPQSAEIGFDELTVANAAMVSRSGIYSVNSMVLRGVRARLTNEALVESPNHDGLGAMFQALIAPQYASGVRLSIDLLKMLGIATGGGLFVQSIEVDSIDVMVGGTAASYVDALRSSEKRLVERLEKEQALAAGAIGEDAVRQAETVARLGRQLDKIRAEIARGHEHGAVIDIRRIRVSGIPGASEDPVALEDIHGQGSSVTGPMPIFGDSPALRNLIRGKDSAPTVQGQSAMGEFGIDIGTIEAKKPLRLVGGVPGAAAAKKDLDDFLAASVGKRGDANHADINKALTDRAAQAERLEALVKRGMHALSDTEIDEVRTLRALLQDFEEKRATIVETFRVEELSLNVDDRGVPELAAARVLATGIKQYYPDGSEALTVGSVDAKKIAFKAELQGGLANLKTWREAMLNAELKADSLTIRDIRHGGTGAAIEEIAFTADATAPGLEARLDRDPKSKDASVHLRSGQITAKGISVPVQAMLLKAERDRLQAIAEKDRAPDEAKRLAKILDMLADLAALDDAEAKARETLAAAKTGKARTAAQTELDRALADRKNWQDRLVVEKLTIEHLDLSLSGLGNILDPDYAFDKAAAKLRVRGTGKDGHLFEQATAEGVSTRGAKGDQTIAAKISVGPVGGEIERTEKGWAVKGLAVGRIAARGLSYQSGAMSVASKGESQIIGMTVDAEIEKGKTETIVKISHLGIDRIVADQLRYEDADKVVDITSGELLGFKMSGMEVVMPEDPKAETKVSGQISIQEVKALTLNATASGYSVKGVIDGKAKTPDAQAISIDLASDGKRTFALNGIKGTADVRELATGNKVRVVWKNLSGTVIQKGDDYTIKDLSIGNLTLSRADWTVGGKQILINDKVTLQGISLDAEAALRPKPPKKGDAPLKEGEEPPKELAKFLVKKLRVERIEAKKVDVIIPAVEADKAAGIDYSARKAITINEAVISGLLVTGFDVLGMKGKVTVTDRVTMDVRAVIGEAARHDLKTMNATASLFGKDTDEPGQSGRELSATLDGADNMTVRLGRISEIAITDVDAQGRSVSKAGISDSKTKVGKLSLANITTGDLIVTDTSVSISDIQIGGPVAISGVDWKVTGAERQRITMETATITDLVKVGKVEAAFRKVPTGKKKEGREETRSELSTVTLTGLEIPKLTATQLRYQGPLKAKEGSKAIDLLMPNAVAQGIVITNLSKDYVANLLTVDANIKDVAAPGFTATLTETIGKQVATKKFGADLTTGEIRADAVFKTVNAGTPDEKTELDSGGFELDNLGLANITGTLSETDKKDKTIGARPGPSVAPSLGVGKIRYDKAGTSVTGTTVKNVYYDDPNLGLKLDIESLAVPDTISIPKSGPVTIPSATITRAGFEIADLMKMLKKSGGGGETEEKLDEEQFWGILDHVDGNVKCNAYIPIHLMGLTDETDLALRQKWFPIDIAITNGKINYHNLWSHTVYDRYKPFASLSMQAETTGYEAGISGDVIPVQDWENSWLGLNVAVKGDVLKWTPETAQERKEMHGGEVRLKRLIRFDPKPADPNATGPDPVYREEIQLNDFEAALSIGGMIPLNLGSTGTIFLGTPGSGGVTALKLNKQSYNLTKATGLPAVATTWSLDRMAVTVEALNFGDTKVGGTAPTVGATFTIEGINDGEIDFGSGSLMQPRRLKGTITKAEVQNLAIDMGEGK